MNLLDMKNKNLNTRFIGCFYYAEKKVKKWNFG